jgi:hypothetical protein
MEFWNLVTAIIYRKDLGSTQPPLQYIEEVMRQGVQRTAYNSPVCINALNTWSYTFTPSYIFMPDA